MTADHVYDYYERPEMVAFVPTDARTVLDVGCSRGGFGAVLRRARPDVKIIGLEPDAEAAADAEKHYDEVVVGAFPSSLENTAAAFDCIVFNDVLEHLTEVEDALAAAKRLLTPTGRLVASIPNVRNLRLLIDLVIRGRWEYTDRGVLDRTHVRFFTRRSIERLLPRCGFEVERLEGLFPLGSRWRLQRVTPLVLRDIAYLEFAVVGCPEKA